KSLAIGRADHLHRASERLGQIAPPLAKLPAVKTRTLSPGEVRFDTEPSITPVPDEARTRTSFLVPIKSFISARTRVKSARKSAVRWCSENDAIAVCAAGSRGVGPGVNKRFFSSISGKSLWLG